MTEGKPEYTAEAVEKVSSVLLAEMLNSYEDELALLRRYETLMYGLSDGMKSGKIRLLAPVLSEGKFSEFLLVCEDAVHYSSKLIYVLDGGTRKRRSEG